MREEIHIPDVENNYCEDWLTNASILYPTRHRLGWLSSTSGICEVTVASHIPI